MSKSYKIQQYPFNSNLELTLLQEQHDYLSWPIVYFIEDAADQEAYVGETTDMISRMKAHLKTERKKKLSSVNLLLSKLFNKSATLDLESHLIRYISADGRYNLINGNLGLANHTFYQQREVYWDIFRNIWDDLRSLGIARHSLEYIDNSDLFKYSPYKSLSREQVRGLKTILECLLDEKTRVSLIHGGAGTGKSILAIFLFKLLKTDLKDFNRSDFDENDEELYQLVEAVRKKYGDLEIALVIPMQSFRKTISRVFANIKGLSSKLVIGPAEVAKKKYDLLIVDEGHRLRKRTNLSSYFATFDKVAHFLEMDKSTCSELDWILHQSHRSVIFYDEFQSIKPSDTDADRYLRLQEKPYTRTERLHSQFRVKGGDQYMTLIHNLFSDHTCLPLQANNFVSYDFRMFEDLDSMVAEIREKEKVYGLSRMVAGFAWKWISKKDKSLYDIEIGNTSLKWNSVAVDWPNSPNAINEVGCIHTTQGYDLNYTGVIIGPELDYDFQTNSFIVYKDRYQDKNGKNSVGSPEVLKNYVLNIYRTILFRGIRGTYIYACNANLRKYLGLYLKMTSRMPPVRTLNISPEQIENAIPYFDLEIAAGSFSDLQQSDATTYLKLAEKVDPERYFACKVVGESMNKIIPNGSVCLFEKYEGGSRNGLITLVELTDYKDADFGSHYTIKEYQSKKTVDEDGWRHDEIILSPKSDDDSYKPIHLRDEELKEFKVIGIFKRVL